MLVDAYIFEGYAEVLDQDIIVSNYWYLVIIVYYINRLHVMLPSCC